MEPIVTNAAELLGALHFAAERHRDQRRKGVEGSPYVNHLIEVAAILAEAGISDLWTLQAAVLHDTLEDTEAHPEELERAFGARVRRIVEEVTDDERLPKPVRKELQVEHAPGLSLEAQRIKIADKISNVLALVSTPPRGWAAERKEDYLTWSERVVAGCRGCSLPLEERFDEAVTRARAELGSAGD